LIGGRLVVRLLLAAASIALVAAGCRAHVTTTGIVDDRVSAPLFELTEGRGLAQNFITTRDNFDAIYVRLATYRRVNTSSLMLRLTRFDGPQPLLVAKRRYALGGRRDSGFLRFDFPAVRDSRGVPFLLEVNSDAERFNGVSLWALQFDGYKDGALYVDGKEQPLDLVFKVRFRPYLRDYLMATPSALLTLQRPADVPAVLALWLAALAMLAGCVWLTARLVRREALAAGGDFALSATVSILLLASLALWLLLGRA
jgi:hypothetical protein